MKQPGQLPWPLNVPSVDPYGVDGGAAYVPHLLARDVKGWSIPSDNPFSKNGFASVPAHSEQEQRVQLACFFCPHVLDIRAQYYYTDDEMDWRILNGNRPGRKELPTLDLMLTINCPWTNKVVYHAISVKHEDRRDDDKEKRRMNRDIEFCKQYGFTFEMLGSDSFPETEAGNHWALFSFLRYQNLNDLYKPAREFSHFLNTSKAQGTADKVLGRIGKRFGLDVEDSYRLFAAAVFFGFVRMDMTHPLEADEKLVIMRET
ncbi:hypothetical protein E5S69_14600 [Cupriavidus necator]|uniref:hypothetical protein n=1 Tax=Cupriavidus necator TaxID=106590 RepID=UPI00148F4864|nr:hypothetical protein [Cupriavidus necator]NOV24737.1 hypothetical protein [Cupriavidus necator]